MYTCFLIEMAYSAPVNEQSVPSHTPYNAPLLKTSASHIVTPRSALFIDSILNEQDDNTEDHSRAVGDLGYRVGVEMTTNPQRYDVPFAIAAKINPVELEVGGLLHDTGKIYGHIKEKIMNPEPLGKDDLKIVQAHTHLGFKVLKNYVGSEIALVGSDHHENYDGSGYPNGKKGDEIPLYARIIKIIDSYHAMTSDRPYHNSITHEEALYELQQGRDTLYDPQITDIVLQILDDIHQEQQSSIIRFPTILKPTGS